MDSRHFFDVIVIGSGPGGYVAAIKVAQRGKKVALVEKKNLGGVCLQVGCIPTKSLITHAKVWRTVQHAADFGIATGPISFDFGKIKERKDKVIAQITRGLETVIKSNGIEVINGFASFLSQKQIQVTGAENRILEAETIIIASGSRPADLVLSSDNDSICDHRLIFDSSSVLELTQLPRSMIILGGGYIGCEFASLYAAFGVKVTLLEAYPSLVMGQGPFISGALENEFKKRGIDIRTGVVIESIRRKEGVVVQLSGGGTIEADMALVAVGRRPLSDGLRLENAGVAVDSKGFIVVNEKMETNVSGIYAIGDITGKVMLAHVASHQGIVAAMNAVGEEAKMNYQAVPSVIFTYPEIATVGLTFEQALEQKYEACKGIFPFQALGRAIASMETEGAAQVVVDKKTGLILGAQVIGSEAGNLIAEMTLAIENKLKVEEVLKCIHAHPTFAEVWPEAVLSAVEWPIHFPVKTKK